MRNKCNAPRQGVCSDSKQGGNCNATGGFKPWAMLSLIILGFLCSCASPPPPTTDTQEAAAPIRDIAVVPFADAPRAEAGYSGQVVTAKAIDTLAISDLKVNLISGSAIKDVLDRYGLRPSEVMDVTQASLIGRSVGADAVLVGSLSEYRTTDIPIYLGFVMFDRIRYSVGVHLSMLDVRNNTVIVSGAHSNYSYGSYEEAASKALRPLIGKVHRVLKRAATKKSYEVKKDHIAVFRLTSNEVNRKTLNTLTKTLRSRITNSGIYHLVDGEAMQKIANETDAAIPSKCNTTESAAEYGDSFAVEKVVMGSVNKIGEEWQIVVKLVDVDSAENLKSGTLTGKSTTEHLPSLVKEAADKMLKKK